MKRTRDNKTAVNVERTRAAEMVVAGGISIDGERYDIEVKVKPDNDGKGAVGRSRLYLWNTPDPEDVGLATRRPPSSAKGDDPELDKEWRAYNRAERIIMQTVVRHEVVQRAANKFGVTLDTSELKFSRKCGCSCGCSPGFILRVTHRANALNGSVAADVMAAAHYDVFVTLTSK